MSASSRVACVPRTATVPDGADDEDVAQSRPRARRCRTRTRRDAYQCPSGPFWASAVDGHGVDGPPVGLERVQDVDVVGPAGCQPAIVSVGLAGVRPVRVDTGGDLGRAACRRRRTARDALVDRRVRIGQRVERAADLGIEGAHRLVSVRRRDRHVRARPCT